MQRVVAWMPQWLLCVQNMLQPGWALRSGVELMLRRWCAAVEMEVACTATRCCERRALARCKNSSGQIASSDGSASG